VKKKILAWLLCAVMVAVVMAVMLPLPAAYAADGDPTTFVLSNEEGGLIDKLIAGGYGDSDLYEALCALEDSSGGVITEAFMDTLAACPAGSEIFTQKLSSYAGLNGGVAINTDGTVFTTSIKGRTYHGQTGYSTYPPTFFGVGRELFTYANDGSYYIDAPNGDTTYKAFAIGWSGNQVPTFMLSNEEGGLIDKLIAVGYGDDSLYEVLQVLKPLSGGTIPDDFMAALAACPADCEAKTAALNNFSSEFNNPIGISADGTLIVAQIYGRDYIGETGYTTSDGHHATAGDMLFTAADSEAYFIDAGTLVSGGETTYYKAFAIGWSSNQVLTFMLSNEEGGLIDRLIAAGHGDDSLYKVLQLLQPVSGGAIPAGFMASLAVSPAGCDAKTAELSDFSDPSNNPIGIGADGNLIVAPVHGRDYYEDTDFTTTTGNIAGVGDVLFTAAESEDDYIDAGANTYGGATYYYKAFAIAWMPAELTTFVLSNEEGGLIDWMITMGYGNSNLYQALVSIAPSSGGVITEDFLEALALNPAGSEIFTQKLSSYAGLNGGVAINTDGTVFTTSIKGRTYHGQTGYSTYPESSGGVGRELFTYADSPEYYIDAPNGGTTYKVFAIGWSAKEAPRLTKLELSGAPPADFKVGDTLDLSELTLKGFDQFNQPYDLTGKPVVWKSADESVAQVEGSKLKALKAGNTNVTATVEDIESNSLTFEVKADIPPPAEVDKLNVTPGDAKLDLSWVDPKDADLDKIRIRWWKTKVEVGEAAVDENVYEVKKGVQEYTITGLTNDTEYTVKVTTVDKAGNESKGIEKKGTPTKAPCFIATAAYGSYLDPHVQTLRDFRDNVLGRFSLGKAFVSFYYQNSPPLANFIARHDTLRTAARIILTPVVYFIAYPQISGIIILLFIAGGILFWLRKREAVKA
jgi:hypothetical protein